MPAIGVVPDGTVSARVHAETGALVKFASIVAVVVLTAAPAFAQPQEATTPPVAAQESQAASEQSGFFNEPAIIGKAIKYGTRLGGSGDGGEVKNGFYPEFGDMITGSGWISGGPGYRHWFLEDRVLVDTSAALSWRMYKMVQGRVEMPRLARSRITAGIQARWQDLTQMTYFGEGPGSLEANRSAYRLENANVLAYVIGKPLQHVSITGKFGWLTRPSIQEPGGTFDRGDPDAATVFPDDPVYQLDQQPNFMYGELSAMVDTRDHRGYPTRGGLYQVSWSPYVDRGIDQFSFHRYEGEAAHFFPFAKDRIVLLAHGWFAGTRAAENQFVPFYLQPSLGGSNSLRAYASYRFHDRNLLMVNAEARIRLFTHIDWAMFADAGNVAPTVGDLNLDRQSYGIGLRVHTERSTLARLDVAHGDEGWRFLFRVNDPFRFSRIGKRTAPMPFVP